MTALCITTQELLFQKAYHESEEFKASSITKIFFSIFFFYAKQLDIVVLEVKDFRYIKFI